MSERAQVVAILRRAVLALAVASTFAGFAPVAAQETEYPILIDFRSDWAYYDLGEAHADWAQFEFDDLSWNVGPGQFGYGDGDEATEVGYGGNPDNRNITTYFRRHFHWSGEGEIVSAHIWLIRDDGAVVYINGEPVARSNMPDDPISYETRALVALGGQDEMGYEIIEIPVDSLAPGDNIIAVEIHQASSTSSDISFDLKLGLTVEVVRRNLINTDRIGDIAYLMFDQPPELMRFDLGEGEWLPSVDLSHLPDAVASFSADEEGVYVASETTLARYDLGFPAIPPQILTSALVSPEDVHLLGDFVYTYRDQNVTSYRRSDGVLVDSQSNAYEMIPGTQLSEKHRLIVGRSLGFAPVDMVYYLLNADGTLDRKGSTRYHGVYPGGSRCFLFPGQDFVTDNSGTIYDLPRFRYANCFPERLQALDFFEDEIPITANGTELIAYSNSLLETGRVSLDFEAGSLFVVGEQVLAFQASPLGGTEMRVQAVPLRDLNVTRPGVAIDPGAIDWDPDEVFVDKGGIIYLMSEKDRQFFRWSPELREYLPPVPLERLPVKACYSPNHDAAFVTYEPTFLSRIDLDPDSASFGDEKQIADDLRGTVKGISAIGDHLFVADGDMRTRTADGQKVARNNASTNGTEYVWDPIGKHVFYSYRGPHRLAIQPDGTLGEHFFRYITGFGEPLRLSPDSTLLLARNDIYDTSTLLKVDSIENGYLDAVWLPDKLVSVREVGGFTQVQHWSVPHYDLLNTIQFDGLPRRIVSTPEGLVLISLLENRPKYYILDPGTLATTFESEPLPPVPDSLSIVWISHDSAQLDWQAQASAGTAFEVQGRSGDALYWSELENVGSGVTRVEVGGLIPSSAYQFRVRSRNAAGLSAFSGIVEVHTLSNPDAPVGNPYRLRAAQVFAEQITLEWDDNADNEDGFRIIRTTQDGEDPMVIGQVVADVGVFIDDDVLRGRSYGYRVQAFNASGDGDVSPNLDVDTLDDANVVPEGAPSGAAVVASSQSEVEIEWLDNSRNEEGFIIQRRIGGALFQEVGRVGYNVTRYVDSGVSTDSVYDYRVVAFNASGTTAGAVFEVSTPPLGGYFAGRDMAVDGVHYFLFTEPDRIERFDQRSGIWLPVIPLVAPGPAMWVEGDMIYFGSGQDVWGIDQTGQHHLITTAEFEVEGIVVAGDILIARWRDEHHSFLLDEARVSETFETFSSMQGLSAHAATGRVFARSENRGPADIYQLDFRAAGTLRKYIDSPAHGDYPDALRTFAYPDGSHVIDDSGTIYRAGPLSYVRSIPGPFTDLDFDGDGGFLVLDGDRLVGYDRAYDVKSERQLAGDGFRVSIEGGEVWVYHSAPDDIHGIRAESYPFVAGLSDIELEAGAAEVVIPLPAYFLDGGEPPSDEAFEVRLGDGAEFVGEVTVDLSDEPVLRIVFVPEGAGDVALSISEDGGDGEAVVSFLQLSASLEVDPPELTGSPAPVVADDDGATLTVALAQWFTDPNGDPLTYSITNVSAPGIFESVEINGANGLLTLDFAPYVSGASQITIRASDPGGLWVELVIDVSLPEISPAQLSATGAPVYDPASGLYRQAFTARNTGSRDVAGFTLSIEDLPLGARVYNGVAQPDGSGFLLSYPGPIALDVTATIEVEYFGLPAGGMGTPSHSIENASALISTPAGLFVISRATSLADGSVLLEFPTAVGSEYLVEMSEDGRAWLPCLPRLRAGGASVQWLDGGPPLTPRHPSADERRLYRVLEIGN